MDPFNPVVGGHKGLLQLLHIDSTCVSFELHVARLGQWIAAGPRIEVRMVRAAADKAAHAWCHKMRLDVNGSAAVDVSPPKEGHKRRDVRQTLRAACSRATTT
eukprot:TRINITY_DN41946_c0_g1_i1.p1 TRINITY_DN41946_c0_g1~~TRINITY_DN41946_c0_g1_i1.p1  ORF type:complete len:113 (-),score=13.23 TRINITY_DN41946_c0_g1_i1:82-390(-)